MRAADLIDEGRRALLDSTQATFNWSGEPREHAIELLTHVLGAEPDDDDEVGAGDVRRYRRLVSRRAAGEPLAYIVGYMEFRDLRIGVRREAFIPRATSEFLAASAIRRLSRRRQPVAVDLATGVGPVALAVAHAVRHAEVHGADLSAHAVKQARINARQLGLSNVSFHRGDLFAPLPKAIGGRVDLITMHPPYVPRHEVKLLPVEIRAYEPVMSLTDNSPDGLRLVDRVVEEAPTWLRSGGWLLFELHPSDVRTVKGWMTRAGFAETRSHRGELRYTRVLAGRRP
ncbi:MAG TPA: HemK/PrmC family methyltransferase [Actinomycetota bacterium]|nr:HemK/PrmC family methyltransferase [Actinomycetota bacterium]